MVGSPLALDVLAVLPVSNELDGGYQRDLFPEALDMDSDGCAARAEVLIRDSRTPAQVDPNGCHVVAGNWLSVYDGQTVTDPAELEVDHVVSVAQAGPSEYLTWSGCRRLAAAVSSRLSRARGVGLNCAAEPQVFAVRCGERAFQPAEFVAVCCAHLLDLGREQPDGTRRVVRCPRLFCSRLAATGRSGATQILDPGSKARSTDPTEAAARERDRMVARYSGTIR